MPDFKIGTTALIMICREPQRCCQSRSDFYSPSAWTKVSVAVSFSVRHSLVLVKKGPSKFDKPGTLSPFLYRSWSPKTSSCDAGMQLSPELWLWGAAWRFGQGA